ncbi:MAG: helix-turn-helix domain-containing protein [Bacteroidales bacterium]|jgi:hypothetical protein|nr:helix-turn-helix domain-containing protein [Bacteroidales bacterium]
MKKIKAIIMREDDGTYLATFAKDYGLGYCANGVGETVEEAKESLFDSYAEIKAYYKDAGKKFIEADIEFEFETAAFLENFSGQFSLSGLERITGINQRQLSHYLNGVKRPKDSTVQKINTALFNFGAELQRVHLV